MQKRSWCLPSWATSSNPFLWYNIDFVSFIKEDFNAHFADPVQYANKEEKTLHILVIPLTQHLAWLEGLAYLQVSNGLLCLAQRITFKMRFVPGKSLASESWTMKFLPQIFSGSNKSSALYFAKHCTEKACLHKYCGLSSMYCRKRDTDIRNWEFCRNMFWVSVCISMYYGMLQISRDRNVFNVFFAV